MSSRTEIVYTCTCCGQKQLNLGWHPLTGLTPQEMFGFVQSQMLAKGWTAQLAGDTYDVLCPECIASRVEARKVLKPYDGRIRCPKCGHNRVGTRYCDGKAPACGLYLPVEHLHRTCQRCGFGFAQLTKDHSPKPKEDNDHGRNGHADTSGMVSASN